MIIAGNLKCNHTRASFQNYAMALNDGLKDICHNFTLLDNIQNFNSNKANFNSIIVFPPSVAFVEVSACKYFSQGAQNFYPCDSGSFTGEVGTNMLDEFGVNIVLIGHSERRGLGENDELIKAKFNFAKQKGYKIIFCVGEDDITYMNASAKEFLSDELSGIDLNYEKLIIAYEPIFAIGTGVSAKTQYIAEILEYLRSLSNAPLLYGGSVNCQNINEISSLKHCDGVLVGSASWDVQNFINLINIAIKDQK